MKSKKSPKTKKTLAPFERDKAETPPTNPSTVPAWAKPRPAVSPKDPRPEYITGLPLHLTEFGDAVWGERDTCRKFLIDAMDTYDDAVYDAVIDATPKEVIAAQKKGREAIISEADSILAVACCTADDTIPAITCEAILADMGEREAGEYIGCLVSAMRGSIQDSFLATMVRNLSSDAHKALQRELSC